MFLQNRPAIAGLAAVILAASAFCADGGSVTKTKVYLMAGQSNMVGRGRTDPGTFTSSQLQTMSDIDVYFSRNGSSWGWNTLAPGLGYNLDVGVTCFGPELTFGLGLREAMPDENIAFVKYAVDGTALATHWRAPDAGGHSWMYGQLVNGALAALANLGPGAEFAGMIWMQGESDAVYDEMWLEYEQNMTDFINCIRRDLSTPDMPFVIGRINTASYWTHSDVVRQAQYNVSQNMTNVGMVDTDDLGLNSDGQHYNTSGQIGLGSRFAAEMLAIPEPTCLTALGLALVALVRRR